MKKFNENRIKKTNRGFNYVEVTPSEVINWGGFCICNFCNRQILFDNLYLVYVLHDVYCKDCFNDWLDRQENYSEEDVLYDLEQQNNFSFDYYKNYLF